MDSAATASPQASRKPLRNTLLTGLLVGVVYLTLVAFGGRSVLEKVVTRLVLPVGIAWGVLFLAGVGHLFTRRFGKATLILIAWLLLTAAGNGVLARFATKSLELNSGRENPLEMQRFDAIVVLGGGVGLAPNGLAQATDNGDRVVLAARMYHAGRVDHFFCTGEQTAGFEKIEKDPNELSAEVMIGLGVPEDAITLVGGSNTSEEMRNLAERDFSGKRIGLISSAWHLSRAMRLAEDQNLTFVPIPSGITNPVVPGTLNAWLLNIVPEASALADNSRFLKEKLAGIVGR